MIITSIVRAAAGPQATSNTRSHCSLCVKQVQMVVHEEMAGWRWNAGLPCGSARLPVVLASRWPKLRV